MADAQMDQPELFQIRHDGLLTKEQRLAVLLAYDELRFTARMQRKIGDTAWARAAASKTRALVAAFGERKVPRLPAQARM